MQDLIHEYGSALIAVVAILGIIAVVSFIIGTDEGSVVGKAFTDLISHFFESASQDAVVSGTGGGVSP
ncbi:MAG: hypothetical protein K6F00_06175 [Lachnospiraceae bacterium]|nr:hypothetical protein [Lachnospiraceae bacterium]